MTTWATMYQEIASDLGGGRSNATDLVKIKTAIIDAIESHRAQHFFFNEASFSFATVDGTSAYGESVSGFPDNLIRLLGDYLYLDIDQDSDQRQEVRIVSIMEIQQARIGSEVKSHPEIAAFFDEQLELWPTPDDVHDVVGRCVVDVGSPIKKWVTSEFKFYKPDQLVTEMDDDYPDPGSAEENFWFGDSLGYGLIKHFALYLLYSGVYKATDGQDQRALVRSLGYKQEIEQRTALLTAPRRVRPYGLDDGMGDGWFA